LSTRNFARPRGAQIGAHHVLREPAALAAARNRAA
jgi:hypothetical protein